MVSFVKRFAVAASCSLAFASTAHAQAEAWPAKPVRLIVGFTPGGAVDNAGRLMAAELQKALGKSFVVENKPGVGGLLALQEVARAAPDGYTLVVGSAGPLTVSPNLFKQQNFDPRQSLEPIIWFVNTPGIVVVRKDLKANNLKELVALSKTTNLNMASGGTGSVLHLMGEYMQERIGAKFQHVPYKGSTPALTDLAGGRVDVMVDVVPSSAQLVKGGQLRALAVTSKERSPQLPDVPTAGEQGYSGMEMGSWMALLAPKGTPQHIVQTANRILNDSLKNPEVRAKIIGGGGEVVGGTPQQLAEQINTELSRWAILIDRLGVKPE